MIRLLRIVAVAISLTFALTWFVRAQNVTVFSGSSITSLQSALSVALVNALPAPADDPLLDSFGNVVLDPSGNPVSDPKEPFHSVNPHDFDPGGTHLVEAAWLDGIGCP